MRWRLCVFALLLVFGAANLDQAHASVQIRISLSQQSMNVNIDGAHYATWAISTGRQGYGTPAGTFRPQSMHTMHYSRRYNMTPIPHYDSDTAFDLLPSRICDSRHVGARNLGRPASHGCIRLSPQNARTLFGLVGRHGMRNTSISISY